jgi:hypothetical protein
MFRRLPSFSPRLAFLIVWLLVPLLVASFLFSEFRPFFVQVPVNDCAVFCPDAPLSHPDCLDLLLLLRHNPYWNNANIVLESECIGILIKD